MAIAAASFIHPKLAVFARTKLPSEMSDDEIRQVLRDFEEDARRQDAGRNRWLQVVK
jgi:2,4-dienoyl-CoA reductase-like NADH-dependent reductase (Old Yellow Enzyme family)